jgi:hypothetical protein
MKGAKTARPFFWASRNRTVLISHREPPWKSSQQNDVAAIDHHLIDVRAPGEVN